MGIKKAIKLFKHMRDNKATISNHKKKCLLSKSDVQVSLEKQNIRGTIQDDLSFDSLVTSSSTMYGH
jgi:hypothetical protein